MKSSKGFAIDFVYFATVPPYDEVKKEKNKDLYYTLLDLKGEMTGYLLKIFDDADTDCKVEIVFHSNEQQENEIRSMVLRLASLKTVSAKESAAGELTMKMYQVTDHRNETGLFIIMVGTKKDKSRVVLCRFKRHEGLYSQGKILQYLKNIFTKSSHYKLAIYEDIPSDKSFWKGYAIDRQTSTQTYKPFSYFWIEDFLQSQTSITSIQGTTQLAKVVKTLLRQTKNLDEQEQIISGILNLKGKNHAQTSVRRFCETYLSPELTVMVKNEVNEDFYNSVFPVDKNVMQSELGATVLTTDEGITVFVPTFNYSKLVTEEIKNNKKEVTIKATLKEKKVNAGKAPVVQIEQSSKELKRLPGTKAPKSQKK